MYRSNGFISFLLRRVTGIALVLYLFTHLWVIGSALQGQQAFDVRLAAVQTPFFKVAEVALLAAVFYHAFDGLRLLLVNWFKVTDYRRSLFYAAFGMAALMTLAGAVPILVFLLEG
jgi:succinate dehydrogenase / fumarate reductase, cytochrome b subunit